LLGVRSLWIGLLVGCAAAPCGSPDAACPAEAPAAGGDCIGVLECFYAHPDFPSDPGGLRFVCEDGRWREEVRCEGCGPRRAESCRTPDTSSEPGAVRLSLEAPPVVIGTQGLAMVGFRLLVDASRPCALVRGTTSIDGMPAPFVETVRLRCGASQTVYAILYDLPCSAPRHEIGLEVEVVGVGRASAAFPWDGADCPPGP